MKILSRDFTLKEKLLILLLSLILVGLAYYKFVDEPVREALASARAEADTLNLELQTVSALLQSMHRMSDELEDITGNGTASEMGSYNNSQAEIESLNYILSNTQQYAITFSDVSRTGDQIRRNFSLSFTVDSFDTLERIVGELANNHYRCLIGDLRCSATKNGDIMEGAVNANTTATFYETMVGGTPDAGLPAKTAAAK